MAGSMAISSSRSDEPADAGKLGEMVVGVAEQGVDGGCSVFANKPSFLTFKNGPQ
jgi:hypothetical protein